MESGSGLSQLGAVVSVRGGAVDIRFADNLPSIYSVLRKGADKRVLVEVLTGKEKMDTDEIPMKHDRKYRNQTFGMNPEPALSEEHWHTERRTSPNRRNASTQPEILETGIKIIDVLLPLELKGKAGLFGMPGVGKTVLLTEIIHNMIGRQEGVKVFCGIGEGRRAQDPANSEAGNAVLSPDMVMIFGQMKNSVSRRIQTGHDDLSPGKPKLDDEYHEVPLLIDSLFRLLHAGMMGGASPADERAITSIQAVQVLTDGFGDPAIMHAFSQLSASMVLSKKRAHEGLYPAIDPLQSNSKLASPKNLGARHYALAMDIRRTLAHYAELKETIALMGIGQLSMEEGLVVARARQLERFFTQPFFTTEQFTGRKGKFVSLKEGLDGCERIMRDEFRDVPENAFYMIGSIGEAMQKIGELHDQPEPS